MAFEMRAKDLPRGKFPNSTFEGSLRPAGEDPAESNDPITDKSRGGCVSPKLPVENIKQQESNMKKREKKKIRLLPCPRLGRDLPPTAASP